MEKIILVGLHLEDNVDYENQFEETKGLAEACEYEIVGEMIQKRRSPHPATFFGEGKVFEIKELIEEGRTEFACQGKHPWKGTRCMCGKSPETKQRGDTSVYFPCSVKILPFIVFTSR